MDHRLRFWLKPLLALGFLLSAATWAESPALHPGYPSTGGKLDITAHWSLTLDTRYNVRVEDDSMVLWRPGITLWLLAWKNDHDESVTTRLEYFRHNISPEAFASALSGDGIVTRFSYRLNEQRAEGLVYAFHGLAFSDSGHIQCAIYVDKEADLKIARQLFSSIRYTDSRDNNDGVD